MCLCCVGSGNSDLLFRIEKGCLRVSWGLAVRYLGVVQNKLRFVSNATY